MKCTLDCGNTKVFAKAVQSLSKFGGDLFVEASKDGVQLRTLNPTKSAVGTYRFSRSFFDCFEVAQNESYCKLDMRACLTVFRNTKQVERCDLAYILDKARFQIQLKCQHETVKNTFISVDDEENVTAEMTPDSTCNTICGSHKIFTEIANNFNPAEEEITLEAEDRKISIKNYVEGSRVNEKFMRSQLQLNADEFEDYKIEKATSITFCLKEFRALLMFAEALNENVCLQFDEAGSPVFVSVTCRDDIHCLLIMSTLSPEEVSFYDSCHETEVQESATAKTSQKRKLKPSKAANQCKSVKQDLKQKCIAEESTLSNSSSLFQFEHCRDQSSFPVSVGIPRNLDRPTSAKSDSYRSMLPTVPSVSSMEVEELQITRYQTDSSGTVRQTDVPKYVGSSTSEDEDCIPESPKRQERADLRTIFSRCFHSTYIPVEPSVGSQIYAPASDTED